MLITIYVLKVIEHFFDCDRWMDHCIVQIRYNKRRPRQQLTHYRFIVLVTVTASPLGATSENCAVPLSLGGGAVTAP